MKKDHVLQNKQKTSQCLYNNISGMEHAGYIHLSQQKYSIVSRNLCFMGNCDMVPSKIYLLLHTTTDMLITDTTYLCC